MKTRVLTMVLAACVLAGGCGADADTSAGPVERVMVVSLPSVTWSDVERGLMPNLEELAERAAVGNVATRVGRTPADTASAYLTMGAGTRAVAPELEAGVALAAGEQVAGIDAADLMERRLGFVAQGIAYLATGPTIDRNEDSVFGADIGMLGDELAEHDIARAVVSNGDLVDELAGAGPPGDLTMMRREAAAFLMRSDGLIPGGDVSSSLLVEDASAAFGTRLDPDAFMARVRDAWPAAAGERAAVLVEASDLHRVVAYREQATASVYRRMRDQALRDADDLFGHLVSELDPDRDAMIVIGVPASPGTPELGVAALWTGDVRTGLLRSSTTGRDGYVQLADLAPTVLQLLGEGFPRDIEGRPFAVSDDEGGSRIETLAGDVSDATFRDDIVPAVTVTFIAVLAVLLAGSGPWATPTTRQRRVLGFVAYAILGAAATTFIVGANLVAPGTLLPYAVAVVAGGLVLGATATAVERRHPGAGMVVALGTVLVVIAVDVALDAPLQVNTVFGYSLAVAGRFVGLGNLAFAIFSASAVLFAAVLADRFGTRGVRAGVAVLVAVVIIDGFPLLGADVGGALSMVPAFGVTALILSGRRVGWVQVAALAVLAVATTLVFAFVDLIRPEQSETHLARFARSVLAGRWESLADTLGRRFQASFGGLEPVAWGAVAVVILASIGYVVLHDRGRLPTAEQRRAWPRTVVAAAAGLAVLALLGWTANDSSFAVPATMLIVVVPVLADRMLRHQVAVS